MICIWCGITYLDPNMAEADIGVEYSVGKDEQKTQMYEQKTQMYSVAKDMYNGYMRRSGGQQTLLW